MHKMCKINVECARFIRQIYDFRNAASGRAYTCPVKTSDAAVYNVYPTHLFLLHVILIKITKIMTKTTGLFLYDGCLQVSCVKYLMAYDNEAPMRHYWPRVHCCDHSLPTFGKKCHCPNHPKNGVRR